MKVKGDLTHARFAAEASRIVRVASKWTAHETLRMHTGEHPPQNLVCRDDVETFVKEISDILDSVRSNDAKMVS